MTTIDRAQSAPVALQPRDVVYEFVRAQSAVVYPPPIFGAWSPVAGAVSRLAAVQISVSDATGFAQILIWAMLADGTGLIVYDGSVFGASFGVGSSIVGTTTVTATIVYDAPGWPQDYTLYAIARNMAGVSAATSSAYTLTDPPGPPTPVDTLPPVVTLVSPVNLSTIRQGSTIPIVIQVTDAVGLAAVFVWVEYDLGRTEVIRSLAGFTSAFAISEQGNIVGGVELTIRRLGGWPSSAITIHVDPVDTSGNTA